MTSRNIYHTKLHQRAIGVNLTNEGKTGAAERIEIHGAKIIIII